MVLVLEKDVYHVQKDQFLQLLEHQVVQNVVQEVIQQLVQKHV